MKLILHIVKKDLRLHGFYIAAWMAALAASAWIDLQILANRIAFGDVQGPADAVALLALVLFSGMLFLADPLPGVRAHWRARPIRGRDLLIAKMLTLAVTAVIPVTIVQWTVVAQRGFPLGEHALELFWNALLLVASCTVPVAAVSTISRSFQDLLLIAIGACVVASSPALFQRTNPMWGQEATGLWILLAGSLGVLFWQYQTRATAAARAAIAALCLLIGSTAFWPEAVWLALRRAASPALPGNGRSTVELEENSPFWIPPGWSWDVNLRGWLGMDLRITDLPAGWEGKVAKLHAEVLGSDRPASSEWSGVVKVESAFLDANQGKLVSLDITSELELFGPQKLYILPLNQSAFLPGVGWCRNAVGSVLRVECQCVLAPPGTLYARWGKVKLFQVEMPAAPRWALPFLHPVQQFTGTLAGGGSYAGRPIEIEARSPIVFARRKLEIRNFPLVPKRN